MKILDIFNKININKHAYIGMPYMIAEAGVNHGCNMKLAKRLIEDAKEGGADAIKFQTYKAKTLASKDSPAYWDLSKEPTTSQYKLFRKYDKFWKKEYEEIKRYCDLVKIEFISTPFDFESASFLNEMMDVFKIASSDITNKPFIEHLCSFGKPIILSTGASDIYEIEKALAWIAKYGNKVALLHCVLNYPTEDENANLGMILDLRNRFPDKIVGYSDHTLSKDLKALEIAAILGARILEKHFTYDKKMKGNDHYHAMDKNDLMFLIKDIRRDLVFMGNMKKKALDSEKSARINARRSLVAKRHIPKGKAIESEDLIAKRPANGISPEHIDKLIGKRASIGIKEDGIIKWEYLE